MESLFLVAGFALAGSEALVTSLMRWLRVIVIIACVYGLLFVYADPITAWSPTMPGASDQPIPILGSFATTATMLLLGAFMCIIQPGHHPRTRMKYGLIAGFLVAFTLLVIQARTTYLQLLALAGLLFVLRPKAIGRFGFALPVLASLLLVIAAFDVEVSGRLTSKISVSFFLEHIESIFGTANGHGGLAEAAEGVSLRWRWWYRLYDQLTVDTATLLTGLGYGIPLTDFRDTLGVVTREPHNSVLSVFGRLGLIGLCAWVWLQVELFLCGFRAYLDCRRCNWKQGADLVVVILAFSVLTLASCFGEDTMEKPYNAIPYYAFWGFALRIAYRLRVEAARRYRGRASPPPLTALSTRGLP
jgi:O-antigen ligase